jgi:hypothetical protein
MKPDKRIKIVAWVIIVSHGIGVFANGYNWIVGDQTYSAKLWICFMVLKFTGVVSGVLMLNKKRLGVYLFLASLMGGVIVALTSTGPYPMWQWFGAAVVMTIVVSVFLLVVRVDWGQHRGLSSNDEGG